MRISKDNNIYDKLETLERLVNVEIRREPFYPVLDWLRLEYMDDCWLKILHEIVSKLLVEVAKFRALYGKFEDGFIIHDDHRIYVETDIDVYDVSCNICQRGLILLSLVRRLDQALRAHFYCSKKVFRKEIRNLQKELGIQEQMENEDYEENS
jgi:hypothetical protein